MTVRTVWGSQNEEERCHLPWPLKKKCWTKRRRALTVLAVAPWETSGTSKKNSTNSKTNMHVWLELQSVQVFTLSQKDLTTLVAITYLIQSSPFFVAKKPAKIFHKISALVHRGRIHSRVARWPMVQQRHCERLCRRAREEAFAAPGEGCSNAALQHLWLTTGLRLF